MGIDWVMSLMGIDFDSKPFYGDKYIKTKIRTFENSIITNFHDKKMPEEKLPCNNIPCNKVPIIMLDFVLYAYEMYHPQTYVEECKYKQQKQKQKRIILTRN